MNIINIKNKKLILLNVTVNDDIINIKKLYTFVYLLSDLLIINKN